MLQDELFTAKFGCGCTKINCKCNTLHPYASIRYNVALKISWLRRVGYRLLNRSTPQKLVENCYWCPYDRENKVHVMVAVEPVTDSKLVIERAGVIEFNYKGQPVMGMSTTSSYLLFMKKGVQIVYEGQVLFEAIQDMEFLERTERLILQLIENAEEVMRLDSNGAISFPQGKPVDETAAAVIRILEMNSIQRKLNSLPPCNEK